jgi:WS/DGAT/MGAT family acyltransferase
MLVYGLDDGGMAVITKAHHVIIDGLLGWQGVLAMLVDLSPDGTPIERQDWTPDPVPSSSDALRHAADRRVQLARERMSRIAGTVMGADGRRKELDTLRALPQTIRDEVLARAPKLPINGPNGMRREVDWTSLPLPAIKAAAKRFPEHVTVNDVVLTVISEGLRDQLLAMGVTDPLPPVRVNVPVSVMRQTEGREQFDQHDSYIVVDLPLAEPDIAKRLEAIVACAETRKATEASVIEEMLDLVFMLPGRERERAWQVLASAKVFNLALSNIQGLQQPLYFRGHPIAQVLALAALPEDHGIRLLALSAEDVMTISVTRSPEVVADVAPLLRGIERGMEALGAARTAVAAG